MISPTTSSAGAAAMSGTPASVPAPPSFLSALSPFGPDHVTNAKHDADIAAIERGQGPNNSPALQSAMTKMQAGVDLILSLSMDAVSDSALLALWHKNKEADDAVSQSKDKIHAHFDRLASQTKERLHQIHKRMEAKKSAGFWGSIGNFFSKIANVVGIVAAVASGGTLGFVAAAAMAASMIMSAAGANEWATLAVSVLGAVAGGVAVAGKSGMSALMKQVDKYVQLGLMLAEAGCKYGKTNCEADALDATAELQNLRNERQQLLQEADKEREAIESLKNASHRAALTVIETLSLNHRTKLASLGAQ
ncbi:MAG: hypothetical protein JRH20_18450 [Deltaproteobacteria bacterium]|nr:hypothetical protein [Deltaproteobacteria bacterium]